MGGQTGASLKKDADIVSAVGIDGRWATDCSMEIATPANNTVQSSRQWRRAHQTYLACTVDRMRFLPNKVCVLEVSKRERGFGRRFVFTSWLPAGKDMFLCRLAQVADSAGTAGLQWQVRETGSAIIVACSY